MAERVRFARVFSDNIALRLFYGVPHDLASVAGYAEFRVVGILAYLNRAVDLGRDPKSFNGNIQYHFLRDDPRFKAILARPRAAATLPEPELVDPLRGLRHPLNR